MNLCSEGHDEVCYESRNCPACDVKAQLDNAEEAIRSLKAEIHDHGQLVKSLEMDCKHLQDELANREAP